MSPTRRTVLLAAALALALLAVPPELVLLAAVGLVTVAWVDARAAGRAPALVRAVPAVAARGVPVDLALEPTEPAPRTRVRQPFPPDVVVTPDEGDGGLVSRLTALRRGRHELPPATSRTLGPLGLARVDRTSGEARALVVYPDVPAARRLARAVREGRFEPQGRRPRGPLGLGTEFEYVREYAPDDDIRQVNWTATARVGRPMSNQYRLDQERDVVLLLDAGRLMAAPITKADGHPATRLDLAVDAAVAVAAVADVLGDRSGVVAFASTILRRLPPGRASGSRVVDAVFDLEPRPEESDHELAFRTVGGGKRALVLVLTDLLDEAAARSLVAAVPILTRRHAVVVAGIADPDVAAILRTAPTRPEDASAQAVAVELVDARRRAVAQLTRAGASVVETTPDTLSERCVAEYLRLKARARV